MKYAIDVSHYDAVMKDGTLAPINWAATGLDMAIIKSSESTYADKAFEMQWKAAASLPRAAYHFFHANVNPVTQALFCWSILEKAGFTNRDYVLLDIETMDGRPGADVLLNAKKFLEEISKYLPRPPMIYTYPYFWRQIGGEAAAWASAYPLALAQWPLDKYILGFPITLFTAATLADFKAKIESGALKPMALKPWDKPSIWQFTARVDPRSVLGYSGAKKAVDYDAIYLDLGASPAARICPTCGQAWPFP